MHVKCMGFFCKGTKRETFLGRFYSICSVDSYPDVLCDLVCLCRVEQSSCTRLQTKTTGPRPPPWLF